MNGENHYDSNLAVLDSEMRSLRYLLAGYDMFFRPGLSTIAKGANRNRLRQFISEIMAPSKDLIIFDHNKSLYGAYLYMAARCGLARDAFMNTKVPDMPAANFRFLREEATRMHLYLDASANDKSAANKPWLVCACERLGRALEDPAGYKNDIRPEEAFKINADMHDYLMARKRFTNTFRRQSETVKEMFVDNIDEILKNYLASTDQAMLHDDTVNAAIREAFGIARDILRNAASPASMLR